MPKKLWLAVVVLALLCGSPGTRAQTPPTPAPVSVIGGYASLSVTNSSSRVALPSTSVPFGAVTLLNSGATDAFIILGGSTVVSTTAATKIKAGTAFAMWVGPNTYIAGITASSTTTLDIWQASGPINLVGGSGSAGVSVTQGTSPWVENITQFGGSNVVTGAGAGGSGIPRVTVSNDSTVALTASTTGGATTSSTIIPNNTTAIVVKGSPGQLYGVECWNNNTTIAYIKVYDAISATAGVGTPAARYMCPASSSGSGFVRIDTIGRQYSTGITYIVTTGIADNDTTAPAANTYIVNVGYK